MGMIDDVVNLVKQGPRVASEIDKVKFNTKSLKLIKLNLILNQ